MREIKFRVWDKNKKAMYNDVYIKWLSPELKRATEYTYNDFGDLSFLQLNDALKNDKEYILMQYTGLKDKNGKEIYEGDILKAKSQGTEYIGKVYYDEAQWFGAGDYLHHAVKNSNAEIIGNIYSNPELIKSKQQ